MKTMTALVACSVLTFAGCSSLETHDGPEAALERAHETHLAAINANDLEAFLATVTDDVVFMPPNAPRILGKDELRPWAGGYLDAFTIHWDKTVLESVVTGDWAFQQYAYRSTDKPKGGGPELHDEGKGLVIFHHDADGVWRVARDAWSSDLPPAE